MNLKIKNCKLKIIFIGTPEFGAIILEGLVKKNYRPILVITSPDKPVGRKKIIVPPPVKITAEKYNLPIFQTEKSSDLKPQIKKINPDLIISASTKLILPKEVLKIPKYGCLNVHPSLLPKYQGPSPIQTAILNGDKKTGISIILMTEKIDRGPVIFKREYPLSNKETLQTLTKNLAQLGANVLIEIIPKWIKGKIKPRPQKGKPVFTKIIKKEDGKINWKKSAEEIERQFRAFYPWPGIFTFWKKNDKKLRLKILKLKINGAKKGTKPGLVFLKDNKLHINCKDKSIIVYQLQLEGKKSMEVKEFLKGHSSIIDTELI